MSLNYHLADMLTQIRNAQQARLSKVRVQSTKLVGNVLDVLVDEGYIDTFAPVDVDGKPYYEITLKYHEGERVIREIECISKPGRRVYCQISKLPKFYNGLGIAILSTSKGVMSDFKARQANVGGEVLCSVF
ncbi:MAG: 30S ribosomal protein S8 [Alphaproteobacteria bacterium]